MRQLKFRVYIPDHEKFCYFELDNFDYSDRYLHQNDYPVQQFTGLKDSKGVEIWEGDIVSDTELCEVKYCVDSEGCYFCAVSLSDADMGYKLTSEFEVVGNIHENQNETTT